ncbi:MAG: acetylornithine transaminase [Armatimonadetes bacterium]|nr:acetylornithine transaminase [Armatimonadota bacterium]
MNYEEIIDMDKQYVMTTYARQPVVFVRGRGARVWDANGKEYLDFLAGIAVNGLGHCHPRVVEAIREQAGVLMHTSNLYYTELQPRLARMLVDWSDFNRVFFCNSGAEANEAAIKLARKWGKRTSPDKFEVATALGSFHGRTMGAITATGQPKYQEAFKPLVPGFKHVPYNSIGALEEAVSDATCAVILEPVQGESGVHPASREYLEAARELCDRVGALLIFDEVQTGLGRTGKLFAYEHFGVVPDVMTLAKTLAGGFPMGACLARGEAANVLQPGDHAATFGGNPLASAAAIASLSAIHEEGLVENARDVGQYFLSKLRELRIAEVRGLGLMVAVELEDPVGKAAAAACMDGGLIVNAIGENILRFLPPLIITRDDVDRAIGILEGAISAVGPVAGARAARVTSSEL